MLQYLFKFQVHTPINARVIAVQKLESLYTFVYCGSDVGGQKNSHQPIFPYNITEIHNSIFIDTNIFKFGKETRCMAL